MTQDQFDARLMHIEEQYAARRAGAEAYRDQEVARLFAECDWTQARIAARMGRSQNWVSKRLLFGRYLRFSTSGTKHESPHHSLTERRFREAWQATHTARHPKETDGERFLRVAVWLADAPPSEVPRGYLNLIEKPGIKKHVTEALQRGGWHTCASLADSLSEHVPGATTKQVAEALPLIRRQIGRAHV